MLAVGPQRHSVIPHDWLMVTMANATAEGRRRLVRIISHPEVQPIALQYLLGQQTWSVDMFDEYPHIDLDDVESIGDFFTAYIGVAHCRDGSDFVYNGSATGMQLSSNSLRGEAERLRHHQSVLQLGHSNIVQQRQPSVRDRPLFIRERMSSPGATYFFKSDRKLCKKCDRSWAYLTGHLATCRGRCTGCQEAGVPCSKLPAARKCERCVQNDMECSGFSHAQEVERSQTACERCGHLLTPNALKTHMPACPGICSECVKENVSCIAVGGYSLEGYRACKRCKQLGLDCNSFSHSEFVENNFVCDRCETAYRDPASHWGHQSRCQGKCDQCAASGVPCHRKRGRRCQSCIGKGLPCTGHSHAGAVSSVERPCTRCGTMMTDQQLTLHERRCIGKCDRCRELGVSCHGLRGRLGCELCRKDGIRCSKKAPLGRPRKPRTTEVVAT